MDDPDDTTSLLYVVNKEQFYSTCPQWLKKYIIFECDETVSEDIQAVCVNSKDIPLGNHINFAQITQFNKTIESGGKGNVLDSAPIKCYDTIVMHIHDINTNQSIDLSPFTKLCSLSINRGADPVIDHSINYNINIKLPYIPTLSDVKLCGMIVSFDTRYNTNTWNNFCVRDSNVSVDGSKIVIHSCKCIDISNTDVKSHMIINHADKCVFLDVTMESLEISNCGVFNDHTSIITNVTIHSFTDELGLYGSTYDNARITYNENNTIELEQAVINEKLQFIGDGIVKSLTISSDEEIEWDTIKGTPIATDKLSLYDIKTKAFKRLCSANLPKMKQIHKLELTNISSTITDVFTNTIIKHIKLSGTKCSPSINKLISGCETVTIYWSSPRGLVITPNQTVTLDVNNSDLDHVIQFLETNKPNRLYIDHPFPKDTKQVTIHGIPDVTSSSCNIIFVGSKIASITLNAKYHELIGNMFKNPDNVIEQLTLTSIYPMFIKVGKRDALKHIVLQNVVLRNIDMWFNPSVLETIEIKVHIKVLNSKECGVGCEYICIKLSKTQLDDYVKYKGLKIHPDDGIYYQAYLNMEQINTIPLMLKSFIELGMYINITYHNNAESFSPQRNITGRYTSIFKKILDNPIITLL
jgi:hypothetical protein